MTAGSSVGFEYVPYHQLGGRPNVVVDGSPTDGTTLTLTHWPGYMVPPGLAADLSAQMAFKYLDWLRGEKQPLHGPATAVSNNHFDQDGVVGLFALKEPELALDRRAFLEDLAGAGDFGTYSDRQAARASMVIAAFADEDRSPLVLEMSYPERTAQLYEELLGLLPELADHTERFRNLWADEDDALRQSEQLISSGEVHIQEVADVDLAVVDVPEQAPFGGGHRFAHLWEHGLHPMAIANATRCGAVLARQGRRYRFTYRYETWVQYQSRRPRPRRDLAPLAAALTALEPAGVTWTYEGSASLTPSLSPATSDGVDVESAVEPDHLLTELTRSLASGPADWDPYRPAPTSA
ncbi:MAG TPA: DUF6687 family protein [Acidimicrobiales bacterium]|nr:DUF6687 family protein [Acidimicrobiales bacterium]